MLRIASMNLMLHGVDNADIHYQDTLSNSFPEKVGLLHLVERWALERLFQAFEVAEWFHLQVSHGTAVDFPKYSPPPPGPATNGKAKEALRFRVLARGMKIAQRREQMLEVAVQNCLSAADLAREIEHELWVVTRSRRDPLVAGTGRLVARANSLAESAKEWKKTLVPRLMGADRRKTVGSCARRAKRSRP